MPPVTFRKDAIQIIEDVKEAVRQWTHYAETGGVLSPFARDPITQVMGILASDR